jgi:hypothetical protein
MGGAVGSPCRCYCSGHLEICCQCMGKSVPRFPAEVCAAIIQSPTITHRPHVKHHIPSLKTHSWLTVVLWGGRIAEGRTTLASAFLVRGKVPSPQCAVLGDTVCLSDFLKSVSVAQSNLRFPLWNPDACKVNLTHLARYQPVLPSVYTVCSISVVNFTGIL